MCINYTQSDFVSSYNPGVSRPEVKRIRNSRYRLNDIPQCLFRGYFNSSR